MVTVTYEFRIEDDQRPADLRTLANALFDLANDTNSTLAAGYVGSLRTLANQALSDARGF